MLLVVYYVSAILAPMLHWFPLIVPQILIQKLYLFVFVIIHHYCHNIHVVFVRFVVFVVACACEESYPDVLFLLQCNFGNPAAAFSALAWKSRFVMIIWLWGFLQIGMHSKVKNLVNVQDYDTASFSQVRFL